jgi:hypothetical protein
MTVRFAQSVAIDAAPDVVWSLLIDRSKWPLWFPGVGNTVLAGPAQSGTTFDYQENDVGKSDDETLDVGGTGEITLVDERAMKLQVVTTTGGRQVTHRFDIDRSGGFLGIGANDSKLEYEMEYDPPGGFISDFVASGNPADMLKVKRTLDRFKALAEGRG